MAGVNDIAHSIDNEGTIDGCSEQILDERRARNEQLQREHDVLSESIKRGTVGQRRVRPRPVTEEYEQQKALSASTNHHKALRLLSEAEQDEEVCWCVHKLRAQIIDFAQAYVSKISESTHQPSVVYLCSNVNNAKLIRYIGFLAQGGANGLVSWEELLYDAECLTALVVGIVGNALKEHVFSAIWFGGTNTQIDDLELQEDQQKDEDGKQRCGIMPSSFIDFG